VRIFQTYVKLAARKFRSNMKLAVHEVQCIHIQQSKRVGSHCDVVTLNTIRFLFISLYRANSRSLPITVAFWKSKWVDVRNACGSINYSNVL